MKTKKTVKDLPPDVLANLESMKNQTVNNSCEHENEWEFTCDSCLGQFCEDCFGRNSCKNCEE